MHWKLTIILACLYGIIKEFRPATPFLTPYLISPIKNFTAEDLYGKIYPCWTYSYLVALIPIFFLTDILRYKPVVCLEAACLCGTWALLVWGNTVWEMQFMQVIFGVASASEIAYFSYMYAAVDGKHYKRVTSFTRGAVLTGKFFSYGTAQLLVSLVGTNTYLLLNQISFGALCVVLVIAFVLPSISSSQISNKVRAELQDSNGSAYSDPRVAGENNAKKTEERVVLTVRSLSTENGVLLYFKSVWENFKVYKTDHFVLKWSIWWALTSCGVFQVQNYMQTLWSTMQETDDDIKNGINECANTLISAILSFLIQYWNINWEKIGEYVLFVTSLIATALILAVSQTTNIVAAYVIYSVIVAVYHTLITAASANIASHLNRASYGLVLGWNTFIALLLQTILTLVVADEHGLNLDIRTQQTNEENFLQFVVYGCYFGVVTILFAFIVGIRIFKCVRSMRNHNSSNNTEQDGIEFSTVDIHL
uniref:Thiamine transporter 2 n=1 Tax=Syphacia muris TaxID=451379 RepID=A0A0N5ASR5_9BILA